MCKFELQRLLVVLMIQSWVLSMYMVDGRIMPSLDHTGESRMTNQDGSHDQSDKANKKKPASESSEMVITPAGPVPKEQVQEVKPGERVRRNKDGTFTKVPESK